METRDTRTPTCPTRFEDSPGSMRGDSTCRSPVRRDARGREDWARVMLADGVATPLHGGTSALSSLAKADGFVRVRANEEGLPAGAEVEVFLQDA